MTKDDRGNLDLTKQIDTKNKEIETLNSIVNNLKNIIDMKEAEITTYQSKQVALYKEIKDQRKINEDHQKLNGKLRLEILNLKKDAKEMLLYP